MQDVDGDIEAVQLIRLNRRETRILSSGGHRIAPDLFCDGIGGWFNRPYAASKLAMFIEGDEGCPFGPSSRAEDSQGYLGGFCLLHSSL